MSCRHLIYPEKVDFYDRFGDKTDDLDEAVFASAACELCGRLAIDIDGVPRPGQLDIQTLLEQQAAAASVPAAAGVRCG